MKVNVSEKYFIISPVTIEKRLTNWFFIKFDLIFVSSIQNIFFLFNLSPYKEKIVFIVFFVISFKFLSFISVPVFMFFYCSPYISFFIFYSFFLYFHMFFCFSFSFFLSPFHNGRKWKKHRQNCHSLSREGGS